MRAGGRFWYCICLDCLALLCKGLMLSTVNFCHSDLGIIESIALNIRND